MGYTEMAGAAGMTLGPIIGTTIYKYIGFSAVFIT